VVRNDQFPEADWKVFRGIHKEALQRFSQAVLADTQRIAADGARSPHERYLELYKLFQERDRKMARLFNDPRRSVALFTLAQLRAEGLLLDEELSSLSAETRAEIAFIARDRSE
jgi:ABC-type nitrate/sulfonate/bicarbonate transport system ATPase subunit